MADKTENQRDFYLFGIAVTSNQTHDNFEFVFISLK